MFVWQTANGLLLLRYVCHFFAQRLSPLQFVRTFSMAPPREAEDEDASADEAAPFESVAEEFTACLLDVLTTIPVK